MKYVILGKDGFIGATIYNILSQVEGCTCIAFARSQCNLLNLQSVERMLSPHLHDAVVIYAAGISRLRSDSVEAMQDNISMVYNLIEGCFKAQPHRVVFLSAADVYGIPEHLPITEETAIRPETLYGIGKVTAELLFRRYQRRTGVPVWVLRLPGVYGPGDKGRGLIGTLIRAIREEREFTLFGDGMERRDFVFVEDIAQTIMALDMLESDGLTLNIATGNDYTVKEIVDAVFDLYGECPIKAVPRTTPVCDLVYDIALLRNTLPDLQMTPLQEGLERYVTQ